MFFIPSAMPSVTTTFFQPKFKATKITHQRCNKNGKEMFAVMRIEERVLTNPSLFQNIQSRASSAVFLALVDQNGGVF